MANGEATPPGWAAIDSALVRLYAERKPRHYGTLVRFRQGGHDPLDGISAYFNARPVPHWHLVSYGVTELYEKESPNAAVSGFGFELTLRVGNARPTEEPPLWAMGLMQALARYVYGTGRYFQPGHFFELGEAPAPEMKAFTAVAFRQDPQLEVVKGPYGAFEFLQVVPLRGDEVRALKAWNTLGLLEVMASKDPLLVASAARSSVLADPRLAQEIAQRTEKDGSSTPRLQLPRVGWQRSSASRDAEVTLAPGAAAELGPVLRGRLAFGRTLEVGSAETEGAVVLNLVPGPANAVEPAGAALRIALTAETARKVGVDLARGAGPWKWPELPGVVFQATGGKP